MITLLKYIVILWLDFVIYIMPYLTMVVSLFAGNIKEAAMATVLTILDVAIMLGPIGRRLVWFGIWLLGWLLAPFVWFMNLGKGRKCPPMSDPLLFYSATKLSEMIRNRQIKADDVIKAYISRCQEVNPILNAVVEPRYDLARAEAKNIDIFLSTTTKTAEELKLELPLLGVPITVKESIAVQGMSHNAGVVKRMRVPAATDADIVKQARAAGAIPIAVTNTPELCMNWETFNYVTGTTKNPYNTRRTPGGSSGGEAALISAGASVIGIGSDIGGSLRLPAMFTGIFGHKPSPRMVSNDGHYPGCTSPDWDDFFTLGPITRYAEDLPLLMNVLKKSNGTPFQSERKVSIKDLKFYYMECDDTGVSDKINADIKIALRNTIDYLENQYAIKVQKVKLENMKYSFETSVRTLLSINGVECLYSKRQGAGEWRSIWPDFLKKISGFSKSIWPCILYGIVKKVNDCMSENKAKFVRRVNDQLQKEFYGLLGNDGILLYPTYPYTAGVHCQIYYRFLNVNYLSVFNSIGLPVTNCPTGLTKAGMPVGLQIVGNFGNDHMTMAVAQELEKAFGGWTPPPSTQKIL